MPTSDKSIGDFGRNEEKCTGNVLNTYYWHALGVETTRAACGWYTVAGKPSDLGESLAAQDQDTTRAEHVRLVESVQRGLNSLGHHPVPLIVDPDFGVSSEHSIQALNEW